MASDLFQALSDGVERIERAFLNFNPRPSGNYTPRQLTMAAAYTVFCHAEIESYLEGWALAFVDYADNQWRLGKATVPLVHICSFHEGRGALTSVPNKNIWSEVIGKAVAKHRAVIRRNNGVKEVNFCELFSPVGFDVREVDSILLADLTAFGVLRGDHARNSHGALMVTNFDPFDRRRKVVNIINLLSVIDGQFSDYLTSA